MHIDKVTEAIAHFIGSFQIAVEQARLRKAYEEFKAQQSAAEETPDLPDFKVVVETPYDFVGFDPNVPYTPKATGLLWTRPDTEVACEQPVIPLPLQPMPFPPEFFLPQLPMGSAATIVLPEILPPGSVESYNFQTIRLSDNDYAGVGRHGLMFDPQGDDEAELIALFDKAVALSPLSKEDAPGSSEEIKTFITNARDALAAHPEESEGDAEVFVLKSEAIDGIYVNGQLVEEAPKFTDYRPAEEPEEEPEEEGVPSDLTTGGSAGNEAPSGPASSASGQSNPGGSSVEADIEIEAGSNLLINSVSVTNNWLVSPVLATVGDHVEINAVIQINVWCDSDMTGSSLGGWTLAESDPTQAFNIAMFDRIDRAAENPAPVGEFPKHWVVTEYEGDLTIVNWIEQFTFMLDNDICVLSDSGARLTLTNGDNTAINQVTLQELGFYYDLIIIGGNIYDANLICQMNILLDNDLVGGVSGFQTTGEGSVSTSGNILWNNANIVNYGGADRFEALPEAYRKAAENLKNGDKDIPDGVLSDSAFAGIGALRVLYITGDYLNLQYIKQTNVLGDNDKVALAMEELTAGAGGEWTISTGTNDLFNFAAIVDVDSNDKTYVGGDVYSDEILIQAEFVSSSPDLGGQDPDVLINEAIIFLDDDMLTPDGSSTASNPSLAPDTIYSDPMQSVLA